MQTDHEIQINVYDEQNHALVAMRLDDVVKRVVASELPEVLEIEAVKAMAIAVRTAVIKKLRIFDGVGCEEFKGADISTGMKGCSSITDMDHMKELLKDKFDMYYNLASDAADSTSGLIITCGGRPIAARYHMTCGGGTENSEDVFGNRVMYFRKVLCSYCSGSPYWENVVDIPVEELEQKLNVKIEKRSSIYGPRIEGAIDDIERDETGRVRGIKIGGRNFSGNEIRDLLNLSSSRFGWDPVVIRIRVRGTGDGVGMCLYGANSLAREGRNCFDILKYYFTNINIEYMDMAEEGAPLKGKVFALDPGHGGEYGDDEKGPTGLREKDVNLDIAKKLAGYLERSGAGVLLLRDKDEDISLPNRLEMVNSIRPNFLISIHQNAFFAPGVSGTEVFCFRGDNEGYKLGNMVLDNIVKVLGTVNRGCKYADLYILRESKVSSIAVECMYITNPGEERRLREDKTLDEIAKSIYRGIMDYYGI